jgi:hypothetical protein
MQPRWHTSGRGIFRKVEQGGQYYICSHTATAGGALMRCEHIEMYRHPHLFRWIFLGRLYKNLVSAQLYSFEKDAQGLVSPVGIAQGSGLG